jgi:hypothetical protein
VTMTQVIRLGGITKLRSAEYHVSTLQGVGTECVALTENNRCSKGATSLVYCKMPIASSTPHGGTGCGSAHSPSPDLRALRCNSAKITFSGAYFRYHQHQSCFTSS